MNIKFLETAEIEFYEAIMFYNLKREGLGFEFRDEVKSTIKRIEENTGITIKTLAADAGYAHGKNYQHLEEKNIDAIIPPQSEHGKPKRIPARRFKYDAQNKIVKCPTGKILTRRFENKQGWTYRATAKDCRHCRLRKRCMSETSASRVIVISNGYEAMLRARRRHRKRDEKYRRTYSRHRWKVEGMHGEAKTQHGLRRAVRRGLANVAIQAYLTAAVINLKRLAAHAGGFGGFMRSFSECICVYLAIQTPCKKVREKIRSKPFLIKLAKAA